MAFSNLKRILRQKSTRIIILLVIDTAFFILELSVGYAVHSLALVADSFHMLNDVLSLCVGLWAVKVANTKKSSKMYTYGWQRAETLGALVNGVFLVALCLSIFLDAISRFVEPQNVSNPNLVLRVGLAGLLSNILGLVLFHDHGHSHGNQQEQLRAGNDGVSAAEQGSSQDVRTLTMADDGGNVADVLPQSAIGGWQKAARRTKPASESSAGRGKDQSRSIGGGDDTTAVNSKAASIGSSRHHRRTSGSRSSFANPEDMNVHPARFRSDFIAASAGTLEDIDSATGSESEAKQSDEEGVSTENSPLLKKSTSESSKKDTHSSAESGKVKTGRQFGHEGHSHTQPKGGDVKAHNHGDLNMRGIFLHVMGDALGNLGVIGSALFIWLTDYRWRMYIDPAVSLIITVIILCSAIPLCKAASRILLQAVPTDINVDDIKDDINSLDGVQNCHHLHVWQLSDTKLIASLHIRVNFGFRGEGSAKYMDLARAVNQCLHEHGIHSSTIQPEFLNNSGEQSPRSTSINDDSHTNGLNSPRGRTKTKSGNTSREEAMGSEAQACLLECGDECDERGQCCAPSSIEGNGDRKSVV